MLVFDRSRVQLAANSLGIGRAALEHAVAYAKERHAFGRQISEFQAVSFRLADAKLRLDQARLLTRHAARLADAGEAVLDRGRDGEARRERGGVFAASAAMQTLAGNGYSRDYAGPEVLRDAKLDEIWDGTSDIMRLVISRSLFG